MENKAGSRKLSTVQFYEALQIEWLVAELRHRIYIEQGDKKYYERVMFGKYETITNISDKNNQLPSIFNDQDYKNDLMRRVYRENGYPIFVYKDEEEKKQQEPLDLLYYYHPESDVKCLINEETFLGKIVSYLPYESVTVSINDKEHVLKQEQVTRIL